MTTSTALAWIGAVSFCLASAGCSQPDGGVGRLDGRWGPGANNVEAARQKMLALVNEANGRDWDRVCARVDGILHTLTWQQATYVYRTSEANVRQHLVVPLIEDERDRFPPGMRREAIIRVLGKPDGDWGDALVYTGEDRASDSSTAGFLFHLDEDKRLKYVGCGP